MYTLARNIFIFFAVILFQVLVMDNIMLNGYLVPYVYLLFILLIPFETPLWLLIIAGFMLGAGIDLLENTAGMHTAASVLVAFIRPYML
ncbi:MAG: rod shape-determining protein MreD, partial [Bacteroidetes bacterium]